ncbi:hypothetical protein AVEN_214709-1 [Araneus ventricosus]|uniref:F-box domain-containing protein n=1 Tax=Araneus ventricosus TaxID=182803 RepID=A0A4Y2S6N7_ARAVE|nr:hypothetical protein AVEN_214709-1 [Araneus ventricosus]
MDSCPVMEVVKKYSSMFRHVTIEGPESENNLLVKNFCRHVTEILEILSKNTQLISVQFRNFSCCFRHIDSPTRNNICRAIADFLASRHHLKRVEFDGIRFGNQETVEVLKKVTENNKKSLTHLKLQNFLRDKNDDIEQDSNALKKLPMLEDLPSLKTLETDYTFIFEKMVARQSAAIQKVRNCQTLVLSKLILHYCIDYIEINDFRVLSSTDWKVLKKLYPYLQIELILTIDYEARRVFQFLILPNMPISHLKYSNADFNVGTEVAVLFDHLLACKTNEHLVSLKIDWEEATQYLSSTINPFLRACKKLKCFVLYMFNCCGIDVLLESWLKNRPESLEKVDILYLNNGCAIPRWIKINEYVSLLKLEGLNISVNIGSY